MATIDDDDKKWLLDNFLTKTDGKNYPDRSEDTYGAIKALIETTLDEKEVATKKDISHLPDKEEFFESQDEQMTELKAIREEQLIQSKQSSRNSDRIEKLEEIHPQGRHRIS